MFDTLLKSQNAMIVSLDFGLAKDFKKAFLNLSKTDDLFYKK